MKVLAGHQPTPEGLAVVRHAAEEARILDAELLLVAFVPNPHDEQASRQYSQDRRTAKARAEETAEQLRAEGRKVSVHVPVGPTSPGEALLQVAREESVDLIVINMRRRSRVGKLLLGSNAQEVLLRADAAVLAVKPHLDET